MWDSVLCRVRYPDLGTARQAAAEMDTLAARRLKAGEAPEAIARSLAEDRTLTPARRTAGDGGLRRAGAAMARGRASSLHATRVAPDHPPRVQRTLISPARPRSATAFDLAGFAPFARDFLG